MLVLVHKYIMYAVVDFLGQSWDKEKVKLGCTNTNTGSDVSIEPVGIMDRQYDNFLEHKCH